MSASTFRCAAAAEERGDALPGTAFPHARVLLVHQPGPWGPRGLAESRCDPEIARRIDGAAASAGMRLQTIRRPGKHEVGKPADGYLFGIADTRPDVANVSWWRADDLAEIADELERGAPRRPPLAVETAPIFLVCTHGRHDACCALRGRPLAQALHRVRPGRVWETTHLGGDRFAANLLVLPTGDLYGRVPPAAAADLADRVDSGLVIPALMRGRIGMPPVVQAALVYAHETLAIAERRALTVVSVERVHGDVGRATLATPHGTVDVTVAVETGPAAQLTCRGPEGARARVYRGIAITQPT